MSDDPLTVCPACESPSLKRKIGLGAGIIFKGGGFYETDFKDKKGAKPDSSKESASPSKGSEGKAAAEPVKSGSKPESKPAASSKES